MILTQEYSPDILAVKVKAGEATILWGGSSETALLALALSVAAETQASAESSPAE